LIDLLEEVSPSERDSLRATYSDDPGRILDTQRSISAAPRAETDGQLSLF
jgi:hypothetical protein